MATSIGAVERVFHRHLREQPTVSAQAVQRAYRKAAKLAHPDTRAGSADLMCHLEALKSTYLTRIAGAPPPAPPREEVVRTVEWSASGVTGVVFVHRAVTMHVRCRDADPWVRVQVETPCVVRIAEQTPTGVRLEAGSARLDLTVPGSPAMRVSVRLPRDASSSLRFDAARLRHVACPDVLDAYRLWPGERVDVPMLTGSDGVPSLKTLVRLWNDAPAEIATVPAVYAKHHLDGGHTLLLDGGRELQLASLKVVRWWTILRRDLRMRAPVVRRHERKRSARRVVTARRTRRSLAKVLDWLVKIPEQLRPRCTYSVGICRQAAGDKWEVASERACREALGTGMPESVFRLVRMEYHGWAPDSGKYVFGVPEGAQPLRESLAPRWNDQLAKHQNRLHLDRAHYRGVAYLSGQSI